MRVFSWLLYPGKSDYKILFQFSLLGPYEPSMISAILRAGVEVHSSNPALRLRQEDPEFEGSELHSETVPNTKWCDIKA